MRPIVIAPTGAPVAPIRPSELANACAPVSRDLDGPDSRAAPTLGGQRRLLDRVGGLAGLRLRADVTAERDESVVGAAGADGGLDEDREQRLAVEPEANASPIRRVDLSISSR